MSIESVVGTWRCLPSADKFIAAGCICGHGCAAHLHGRCHDGLCRAGLPIARQSRRPHDRRFTALCLYGHLCRLLLRPSLQDFQGGFFPLLPICCLLQALLLWSYAWFCLICLCELLIPSMTKAGKQRCSYHRRVRNGRRRRSRQRCSSRASHLASSSCSTCLFGAKSPPAPCPLAPCSHSASSGLAYLCPWYSWARTSATRSRPWRTQCAPIRSPARFQSRPGTQLGVPRCQGNLMLILLDLSDCTGI